jgi:hypothetical protein
MDEAARVHDGTRRRGAVAAGGAYAIERVIPLLIADKIAEMQYLRH